MTHQQPNQKPIRLTLAGESIVSPRRRRHLGVRPDPPHVWLEVGVSLLIALIGGLVVYGAAILSADLSDAHAGPVVQAMVPAPPPPVRDPVMVVLNGRLKREHHNQFLALCGALYADKTCGLSTAAGQAILGNVAMQGCAKQTFYCNHCDPSSRAGGWQYRAYRTCSASRNLPLGAVIWVQGYGLLTVTDRGGAVRVGGSYTRPGENANIDIFAGRRCPHGCNDGTQHEVKWRVLGCVGKGGAK